MGRVPDTRTDLELIVVPLEQAVQPRTYEARDLLTERRAIIKTFAILQHQRQLR